MSADELLETNHPDDPRNFSGLVCTVGWESKHWKWTRETNSWEEILNRTDSDLRWTYRGRTKIENFLHEKTWKESETYIGF